MRGNEGGQICLGLLLLCDQAGDLRRVFFGLFFVLICDAVYGVHVADEGLIDRKFFICKQIIGGLRHKLDLITQVGFLADKNPSCLNPVVYERTRSGESLDFIGPPLSDDACKGIR